MEKSLFSLEIYEPGDVGTVVGAWPLTAPISFAVGDVIDTVHLSTDGVRRRLRVTSVEHAMRLRGGQLAHKLMVFTELEPA